MKTMKSYWKIRNGSGTKIVKLAGDHNRVTEIGTEIDFPESAHYLGQVGRLPYSLGSVSGETSPERVESEILD